MELLRETIKAAPVVPVHPTVYLVLPYTMVGAGLVLAKVGQINLGQGELLYMNQVLLIQAQEEVAMEQLEFQAVQVL